jgi:hypothetical protein
MSEAESPTVVIRTLREWHRRDLAHLLSWWAFERDLKHDRALGRGPTMIRLSPQREAVTEEDWRAYLQARRKVRR